MAESESEGEGEDGLQRRLLPRITAERHQRNTATESEGSGRLAGGLQQIQQVLLLCQVGGGPGGKEL
ncbi:hypothetical protein EYF80_042900 [Liparis tanakae]|uniref:Uncharacterized protein n=1 Tax=Liparis tanakae TaxID=230148 RepID=A0A4Z2G079_9TELE|nr:hypothetical protein EYF80_042900 [Liparis tanakae]